MKTSAKAFNAAQREKIVDAIQAAEKNTSGEIKVHIENRTYINEISRARYLFFKLKVHLTNQRNGVLIYVALKSKRFAIIGDIGIHKTVPDDFWESTRDKMKKAFAEKNIVDGICEGIHEAGQQLKQHYPYQSDDENEVSDEISFS